MNNLTVLSLCDGMSCGQIALKEEGFTVNQYFACEIEPHAIKVTMDNFPDTQEMGDVMSFGMSMKQIMFKDSATAHPVGWFDAVITCPPYYDTKVYTDSGVENLSYDEFLDWLDIVVKNFSNVNYFCFQINQKYKVDMCRIVVQNGFDFIQELTGKQKVSHFNRTLDKKKSEYESMLVYKKR